MKLSNIANVFDVEHDDGRLIEIGLTTVSLKDRQILQSHSIAIKPDFELTAEISRLTGWTTAHLNLPGSFQFPSHFQIAWFQVERN